MTSGRRRSVFLAVLTSLLLAGQLTSTPASAAPGQLPPECTPDFTPLTCNPATIIPAPDVGESGMSPDPIGLVGIETWFAYVGVNGDFGHLSGPVSLCQNTYRVTIFGIPFDTPWGVPYPWLGPCPAVPPPGTPGTPGPPWFCLILCANNVNTVISNVADLWFFLGILPAGYDVDFGSPDEAGDTVRSIGSWPSFLTHEYEQKGLHTVDYRIYWRPWIVGFLSIGGVGGLFLPFAFGASQISHTSLGQYSGAGPGGAYQVDESRGTLEP